MGTIKLNKSRDKEGMQEVNQENVSISAIDESEGKVVTKALDCEIAKNDGGFIEEIKELRTANETVYKRNDGTCRKIITVSPTRYRDDSGEYKEISNRLTDNGREIVSEANSFKVKFDKSGASGKIFEMRKGGKKLTLSAGGKQPREHTCGCKCGICAGKENAVIATMDDGTEIEYITLNDRVKENIIVKERQEKYEYNFTLNIGDMTVEEGEHNDLLIKDKETGKTEFRIPAPYMYDANKKRSNKVSYEIDVNGSELEIKVVADAEFINAKDRAFPVVIDPQIIDQKTTYEGISFVSRTQWLDEDITYDPNNLEVRNNGDVLTDATVTYKAPSSIPEGHILDVKLILSIDTGMGNVNINGDIYDAGANDTEIEIPVGVGGAGSFKIYCARSDFWNNYCEFRDPWFVIDYIEVPEAYRGQEFNANNPPMIKDFDFTDKATGHVYAKYGTLATAFKSFDAEDFVLPLNISHCHKVGMGKTEFGMDWRLNLNRKLKSRGSSGYLYIDDLGDKYILSEKYYYADGDNVYTVNKQSVTIDVNGNMTYEGKPVYKYQTFNGLTLIPEIKDFINYDLVQQKSDEIIQLEDYINQLAPTLKNYVIVSSSDGQVTTDLSSLTRSTYDEFIKKVSSSDLLLSSGEATQLRNLYLSENQFVTQISQLEQQLVECNQLLQKYENNSTDHLNAKEQNRLLEAQISNAGNQLSEIKKQQEIFLKQARENVSIVKETFIRYFSKEQELTLLRKQTPVNYLRDENEIISGFNSNGDLVLICDKYGNGVNIVYDAKNRISEIYDTQGKTMNFEYQGSLLYRITDNLGRRVQYTYKGNELIKVVYADGSFIDFEYQGKYNIVRSVMSSTDFQAKVSVDDFNRVTNIATNSKPVTISAEVLKEKDSFNKTIANIAVDYDKNESGEVRTTFTSKDNKSERYTFNSINRVKLIEKTDNDFVKTVTALTYDSNGNVTKSVIQHDIDGTEEEFSTFNTINQLKSKTSGWKNISDTAKVKTEITYLYDGSGNLIKEITTEQTDVSGTITTTTKIKIYSYNPQGSVTLTESYINGEEATEGKNYEKRIYDENGKVTKTIRWNSLDSTSKFYTESDRAENGQVTADRDETGKVSAEYEYVDGTNVVNSVKYPNGSSFAYGRNPNNFEVTGITRSTDDGEENVTDIAYNYGLPVEVKSGNTTLGYTYDHTRRKIAVAVNGVTQATYTYKDYTYNTNQNKCTFGEQTTVLDDGNGTTTTVLQSKTGVLDSESGRIKATEVIKINSSEKSRKEYDQNGRLISLKDSVSGTKTYVYDYYDNVTSITGGGLSENYRYNDYGEVTQKVITMGEETQTYSYTYKNNAARSLKSISVADYTFKPLTDVNGRNTGREIYGGENKLAAEYITYRKAGDHATNMPATVWFGSGSQIKDSIKYKYDSCGNICRITENGHVIAKYEYDSLNRLIREDNKPLNKTVLYSYDQNGNITERCEYAYTLKSGEELEELKCTHYSYDYEGDKLKEYNGEAFEYNNLGCPTTYRGKTCGWQYGKMLASYNGTLFEYDGLGRRTSKGKITFTYDSDGRLIKQSNGLEFIYDNSGVVGVKYGGAQYFYRKDAQGNIIAILDSSGKVVVKYEYDAWGKHKVVDASGIGVLNPFRYRGYYYDTETGLYYLQTRYYDPELGRFISQDSLEYADPETINGLNLYAYCGNNPVMGYDPTGTWNWGIFASIVTFVASVVAVVVGTALTITGIGAPLGAVLIGAGVGGLIGMGGSILSQGISNGWDNINWGQVAFNGVTGALIGGLMASPLGAIATGALIAGVGFGESVGNDLFENDFDRNKVHWGTAIVTGLTMGIISGLGKPFVNFGNSIAFGFDKFTKASIPVIKAIAKVGSIIALVSKLVTSGIRVLSKFLTQKIKW